MQEKKKNLLLHCNTSTTKRPQIRSIPGISPKERDRYEVVCGDQILGTRLTIDEALQIAGGAR